MKRKRGVDVGPEGLATFENGAMPRQHPECVAFRRFGSDWPTVLIAPATPLLFPREAKRRRALLAAALHILFGRARGSDWIGRLIFRTA